MSNIKSKLLESALNRFDVPGLVDDILDDVLKESLQEVVADTKNTLDDSILEVAYPLITPVLKRRLREKWEALQGEAADKAAA